MKNLKAINSSDNLIKAYPNQFKGIGKFQGTYHMPLRNVDKKLDQLLEQVIVPVTEPTDWVSSLAYSFKADGDRRTCFNPIHLNKVIR